MPPTYEYQCDNCETSSDVVKPMAQASDIEECAKCGKTMRRVYSSNIQFVGTAVKDAEYYPSFGEVVKSDRHRKDLMKKHNVIEIGNERPERVRHYTERDRIERLKKDYED